MPLPGSITSAQDAASFWSALSNMAGGGAGAASDARRGYLQRRQDARSQDRHDLSASSDLGATVAAALDVDQETLLAARELGAAAHGADADARRAANAAISALLADAPSEAMGREFLLQEASDQPSPIGIDAASRLANPSMSDGGVAGILAGLRREELMDRAAYLDEAESRAARRLAGPSVSDGHRLRAQGVVAPDTFEGVDPRDFDDVTLGEASSQPQGGSAGLAGWVRRAASSLKGAHDSAQGAAHAALFGPGGIGSALASGMVVGSDLPGPAIEVVPREIRAAMSAASADSKQAGGGAVPSEAAAASEGAVPSAQAGAGASLGSGPGGVGPGVGPGDDLRAGGEDWRAVESDDPELDAMMARDFGSARPPWRRELGIDELDLFDVPDARNPLVSALGVEPGVVMNVAPLAKLVSYGQRTGDWRPLRQVAPKIDMSKIASLPYELSRYMMEVRNTANARRPAAQAFDMADYMVQHLVPLGVDKDVAFGHGVALARAALDDSKSAMKQAGVFIDHYAQQRRADDDVSRFAAKQGSKTPSVSVSTKSKAQARREEIAAARKNLMGLIKAPLGTPEAAAEIAALRRWLVENDPDGPEAQAARESDGRSSAARDAEFLANLE